MSTANERAFKKMKTEEENQQKEEDENEDDKDEDEEDRDEEDKDQKEDKKQDSLFQFVKDLPEHRNDEAGKLGGIQSLTMCKKKNAEAAVDELRIEKNPTQQDEEFLLGEVDQYDRRLKLVKDTIEKASTS